MIMKYRRLVTDVEAERIEEGQEPWPKGIVRKQQLPTFNRYRKDGMPSKGAKLHWIRGKVKFGGAKKSAMWPSVACVITLRGVLANKLGIISVLE